MLNDSDPNSLGKKRSASKHGVLLDHTDVENNKNNKKTKNNKKSSSIVTPLSKSDYQNNKINTISNLSSPNSSSTKSMLPSLSVILPQQHQQISIPMLAHTDQIKCIICNGGANGVDEDMVLLCDGKGCLNEIHIYCLKPVVTIIPDGEWYCPTCDTNGNTTTLENLISSHNNLFDNTQVSDQDMYNTYLITLQQKYYSFNEWKPNLLDILINSEFDEQNISLIGKLVNIYNDIDDQYHTGRIISRRLYVNRHLCSYSPHIDSKIMPSVPKSIVRWEHLVQFRRYAIKTTMYTVESIAILGMSKY